MPPARRRSSGAEPRPARGSEARGGGRGASSELLADRLPQRVEPAPQPRVDRPARKLEEVGDLAGGVLEQVPEDDHGTVLRREGREAGRERACVRVLGGAWPHTG